MNYLRKYNDFFMSGKIFRSGTFYPCKNFLKWKTRWKTKMKICQFFLPTLSTHVNFVSEDSSVFADLFDVNNWIYWQTWWGMNFLHSFFFSWRFSWTRNKKKKKHKPLRWRVQRRRNHVTIVWRCLVSVWRHTTLCRSNVKLLLESRWKKCNLPAS